MSGQLTMGPKVAEFEAALADACGVEHTVAVSSGTAALHLAMLALGLGPGDEVLVPTMTFVSTAMAANYQGAVPVFCDVERHSLALDTRDARQRRTLQTRAVVPVLYGGRPIPDVDLELPVVYDCAHAAGSAWHAAGRLCCWSFHAVKNVATGDGGMLTTDDAELYRRAQRLRWLGIDRSTWQRSDVEHSYWWEYRIDEVGFKYHMNDIAAALGLAQLEKLDEMQALRHRLVRQYLDELADVPGLELPPYEPESSWHLFVVRSPRRDELSLFLQERGISTGVHYKPIHLYPLYHKYDLPVAEAEWVKLLTLPLFPGLTSEEVSFVCDGVRAGLRRLEAA